MSDLLDQESPCLDEVRVESILELCFDQLRYSAKIVRHSKGDFLSIAGSKKGSRYQGGGIGISDLNTLEEMIRLIRRISDLKQRIDAGESPVDFFCDRGSLLIGETKCFNGNWYYRTKVYTNYFVNKKTGERHFFKGQILRPAGRGFYIKEFDFPISSAGIEMANAFTEKLRTSVEDYICARFDQTRSEICKLIESDTILVGGALPWINSDPSLEKVTLHKPIFNIICDELRGEPLTPDRLATRLGLNPELADRQLSPGLRYDPRFLSQGFLLDRVRRGYGSLHYLITQIPKEALDESPSLDYLFKELPPRKWPDWIRATFSNDDYSTGRTSSLHFAEYEIAALEGGFRWGIMPELRQLRATAIRLFDLKRHFQKETDDVDVLIKRFISITKEAGFD